MSKAKNKIRISFPSPAAEHVTGSMTYIKSSNRQIILDCGLHQSNSLADQYQANSRKLPFKARDLDYIFICHMHADHALLLPRLIREGFQGRIIVPTGFSVLFPIMAKDSLHIMERDIMSLDKRARKGHTYAPLYEEADAKHTMDFVEEYDCGEKIELDDEVSFQFYEAGHIIGSAQVVLWIKEGNQVKKIGYTSDIGGDTIGQYYSGRFEPIDKVQCLIGEATYSRQERNVKKRDRINDLNKMRDIIKDVCCEKHKKVLIPSFSLSRSQNILTHLYNLFADDPKFKVPIIVDSPLTVSICKAYKELLSGDELELYKKVLAWDNVKMITDYKDSLSYQNSKEPCVIVASSGMITAGRSVQWAKTLLPGKDNHILFVGFSTDGSIASKIRAHKQKTISIEKRQVKNNCKITSLLSFSSHADQKCLLDYYSNIVADKICLVHSEQKSKIEFAKVLQEEVYNKNKTTKIVAANKSTTILV